MSGGSLPVVRARLRATLRGLRGPHRRLQPSAASPSQHAAHGRPQVPAAPGASVPELLPVSAAALVRAGVRDKGLLRGPIQRFLGVSRDGPSGRIPQHAARIRWLLIITTNISQYNMNESSFLQYKRIVFNMKNASGFLILKWFIIWIRHGFWNVFLLNGISGYTSFSTTKDNKTLLRSSGSRNTLVVIFSPIC